MAGPVVGPAVREFYVEIRHDVARIGIIRAGASNPIDLQTLEEPADFDSRCRACGPARWRPRGA